MTKNMKKTIPSNDQQSLAKDVRGLSTVEYLILLVVIAVAGISIWKEVGQSIKAKATDSKGQIDALSVSNNN